MYRRPIRGKRGAVLVEGVVATVLLIGVIVCGVLLILATGTAMYYKLKLATVADAAARVVVDGRYWLGAQRPDYDAGAVADNATTTINTMLDQLGMPTASSVIIDPDSAPGFAKVTITVSALPIFSGSTNLLPSSIALTDSAVQPYIAQRPIGVYGLTVDYPGTGGQGIYLPTYGAGAHSAGPTSFPTSSGAHFPYWETGVASDTPPMCPPSPYQDTDSGPPFSHY